MHPSLHSSNEEESSKTLSALGIVISAHPSVPGFLQVSDLTLLDFLSFVFVALSFVFVALSSGFVVLSSVLANL